MLDKILLVLLILVIIVGIIKAITEAPVIDKEKIDEELDERRKNFFKKLKKY